MSWFGGRSEVLGPSESARVLRIHVGTLRRWDREGRLHPSARSGGGHRRPHGPTWCTFLLIAQFGCPYLEISCDVLDIRIVVASDRAPEDAQVEFGQGSVVDRDEFLGEVVRDARRAQGARGGEGHSGGNGGAKAVGG